jgi:hypothetical protein
VKHLEDPTVFAAGTTLALTLRLGFGETSYFVTGVRVVD